MKKSKKLISLLLALVLLLSIIPMAAAADGTIVKDGVKLYTTTKPTTSTELKGVNGSAITKNVGENGVYQRLPRDTNIHTYCNTVIAEFIPEYYAASTATVELTDPTVLSDFSYTISGWQGNDEYKGKPCLTFNFTAAKSGSTTVKLTYYYNYNHAGETGYCNGCGKLVSYNENYLWYKQTSTFTVTVGDGEVPTPNKPDKPTVSDVNRFRNYVNTTSSSKGAVYMWCDTYDHQAWFDYITDVDDAYTLGDVVANDGSVLSKSTYPWICVMTLDANKYLDAYNDELGGDYGTHYLKDGQAATETATWYWNAGLSKWQFRSSEAPIYIDITHTAPTPSVTKYTVTYTDGVENEEVFADQVYTVKKGDKTPEFVGEPTRKGYKFAGWEPEVAETVTGDVTYTATWEAEIYTITYDFRKVKTSDVKNLNNPTTFTVEDLPLTLNAPIFKNNEWPQKFLNWRDADGKVVTEITEPGDITLYAYYQFPVRYRVYDEDGKEVKSLTVIDWYDEDDFASYEVRPATVDMPGYELDGWYQDLKDAGNVNKRFGSSLYMAKKYELVGKLSCCITVTYTDGVENEEVFADQVYTVKEGDATPAFEGTPTREGYVFLGWEPEVAGTVTGNATYTAMWEEALTEVKVTSSISEGALLYLASEFKVTATANTDANLTFNFEANPAFKQIASDATGNSKTVWYRVVKITGNYTKINVSVTGTKGNQEPVTGTLSFGVNLRNRIHVTIKNTAGEIISNVTNIKLNHKYPQWNTCPALKYDAAKQEYVMKNPWDLSSQEFVSVTFDYEGDTYETKVTKDGRNLFDVIRAGEEEIYVEYIVVDPIYVTVEVDGEEVKNEKFKGNAGEKLNYSALYWEVMNQIQAEGKMATVQILIDNVAGSEAVFGTNKNVKIVITTIG